MGAEAACTTTFRGKVAAGKARLETDVLHFRGGDLKLTIPFKEMKSVTARGSKLTVTFPDGKASFDLGRAAAAWAEKILHPPSRIAKLGAKPDWTAAVIGISDGAFLDELQQSVGSLIVDRVASGCDAIFFGASDERDLTRLATLKKSLKPNGAIWIVRPKGRPEISERATMAAGKAAGLVDVKVVSFSSTHTAEKFVIPVARRSK